MHRSHLAGLPQDRFGKVIDMNRPETIAVIGEGELKQADLSELLPFADLSEQQTRDILNLATVHRVAPNRTYFDEGDSAENFFVLLDGFTRVVRTTREGDQVVVLHVAPGQMFGIAKAFASDKYTMTARAASQGVALSWPSALWDRFIQEYPGFQTATRQAVGSRVVEMQDKIVSMATKQVEQRIAEAILRLMDQAGKETDAGVEIDFPLTRQDISEMAGTTLHSVSRCMSKWQKSGILRTERRRVVVCQPEALAV
ncbi:MAG: Crp/Fnr family transcriptional regulator [Pseudomonadota bacterium]